MKQREFTWDVLKFLLIVFVILGHWLLNNLNGDSLNRVVYQYRGLFTMPLFVFISGYFSRKKETDKFIRQMLNLFETYVIVQILYVVSLYVLFHVPFKLKMLYIPDYSAWFLLSLMFWRVIVQVTPEKWLKSKFIVPFCVLISLVAGFLPVNQELSLQRTLAFSPFFVCGYLLKGEIKFGTAGNKMKWLCTGVLIAVFVVCCVFSDKDITNVFYCRDNYYNQFDGLLWEPLLFRTAFLVVATIMVFCILKVFPKSKKGSFLSQLGADTMYYYVYHVLVMRVGLVVIRHYDLPLTFPAILLYTLLTVVLIFFVVKISFFRKLINPISSYFQK